MRIYNGSSAEGELVAEYNNDQPPPASTAVEAGSTVFVQFASDNATAGKGFQARYDILPNTVKNISNEIISLYPNPAGETLYLEWNNGAPRQAAVFIYSNMGQLVLSNSIDASHVKQINIVNLRPGVYYLNLISGKEILRQKFIKE